LNRINKKTLESRFCSVWTTFKSAGDVIKPKWWPLSRKGGKNVYCTTVSYCIWENC